MIKFDYVVKNVLGIHARPAALLAQFCVNSKSAYTNVRSIYNIRVYNCKCGDIYKT